MNRIAPGQIYRSCDPRGGPRIRITAYTPGDTHAYAEDANTGKRPRRILVRDLHPTAATTTGTPRRAGYALENQ